MSVTPLKDDVLGEFPDNRHVLERVGHDRDAARGERVEQAHRDIIHHHPVGLVRAPLPQPVGGHALVIADLLRGDAGVVLRERVEHLVSETELLVENVRAQRLIRSRPGHDECLVFTQKGACPLSHPRADRAKRAAIAARQQKHVIRMHREIRAERIPMMIVENPCDEDRPRRVVKYAQTGFSPTGLEKVVVR